MLKWGEWGEVRPASIIIRYTINILVLSESVYVLNFFYKFFKYLTEIYIFIYVCVYVHMYVYENI